MKTFQNFPCAMFSLLHQLDALAMLWNGDVSVSQRPTDIFATLGQPTSLGFVV
jgi:hypothetical protein